MTEQPTLFDELAALTDEEKAANRARENARITTQVERARKADSPTPVRYSFIEQLERRLSEQEQRLDGVAPRFRKQEIFSRDIDNLYVIQPSRDHSGVDEFLNYGALGDVCKDVCLALATPRDNKMTTSDAVRLMEDLGFTDIHVVDPEAARRVSGGENMVSGFLAGHCVAFGSGYKPSRATIPYQQVRIRRDKDLWRAINPKLEHTSQLVPDYWQAFGEADFRSLAAWHRATRFTTTNPLYDMCAAAYTDSATEYHKMNGENRYEFHSPLRNRHKVAQHAMALIASLVILETEQEHLITLDGQRVYLRHSQSKEIAGVFDDKKHPKPSHVRMASSSPLLDSFRKLEIDNDVAPSEFYDFVDQVAATLPYLPQYDAEHESPELRIRYLGKHRATGLYSPYHHAIAVDVRDSGSFVHEYAHSVDFALLNGISSTEAFTPIAKQYGDLFPSDKAGSGKYNADYYKSPAEVLARGYELYAVERLGINNRLVRPGKFNTFPFEPFHDDALKQQIFTFFDEHFTPLAPEQAPALTPAKAVKQDTRLDIDSIIGSDITTALNQRPETPDSPHQRPPRTVEQATRNRTR